jgi:uncharacterized RDD family membrane protein YckC
MEDCNQEKENQLQVSTTFAGFWIRLLAFSLDVLALYSLSKLVRFVAGQPLDNPTFLFVFFELTYMMTYFVAMTIVFGQTLGKMVMGIRVVTVDGTRSMQLHRNGLAQIFYREIVGKLFSLMTLGFGFFMIGWQREKKALHDLIAETKVIIAQEKEIPYERTSSQ